MSPEILTFVSALMGWALDDGSTGDFFETLGGVRDGRVPPFAQVVLSDGAAPSEGGGDGEPGLRVRAILPQQVGQGEEVQALATFGFNEWPLSFATHNARLTAEAGRNATVDQWVIYVADGRFRPAETGPYTFTLTFRAPQEMSCYALMALAGDQIFPGKERKYRKSLPPRIVMEAGERRTFQRQVALAQPGDYPLELAIGCHVGKKPDIRVPPDALAAWQATEVNLTVMGPGESVPRAFEAEELLQP